MKHKRTYITGLIMLLAVSVQAAVPIPDPLPAFNFTSTPASPTSQDTVDLRIEGLWPNSCVPDDTNVFIEGDTIEIRLLLPGAIDCDEPDCMPILSAFGINVSVGPLAPGVYAVVVRVVSCTETTDPQSVGSFAVGIPTGEPGMPVQVGPGTCVVLLQDCANGGSSLRAGQAGIVVCCDSDDCSGRLLVSWFLNLQGMGSSDECSADIPRAIPPASATWVDPARTGLGICFDQCGVLGQNSEGCFVLETDDGRTYILVAGSWLPRFLGPDAEFELGDRIRVQGLLDIMRPTGIFFACTEQDGDIFSPFITLCAPAGGGNGNGTGNGALCPLDNLTIGLGSNGIHLFLDPDCPDTPRTFSDCVIVTVTSDFRARLSLNITPEPGVNGTWQGTITPDLVPAGQSNVLVCITADGVNLAAIPTGQNVKVAQASILGVPEPAP